MDVQPQLHPPVPSLPADVKSPATHGSRPRRRSSSSAVPADIHVKKRSANIIRTQTASPEVISSLIDSLSAISASRDNYFENLPLGYGDSASVPASPLDLHDAAFANGTHQSLSRQTSHLTIDDACEPPVVRTSKPPSGLSPITAPKKKDKENSLRSYMSRGGDSSASVHSAQSIRSVSSIGNISVEAGIPRKLSDSSTRTSAESKRSVKAHRSLMYMSSRERLRLKDAERKRSTAQGAEAAVLPDIVRKPVPQRPVNEDTINEEPVVAESSRAAQRFPSRGTSPLRNGLNFLNGTDGGSPTEKGLIPERGSSLRHSGSPSRKSKKSEGRKSSRHDSYKTNTVLEEDETVDQENTTKEKILEELEAEEDEVARRIRELRKQKMLRDKIAGKLPVGVDAGASVVGARVSPGATTQLSPTSSVSSLSERRMQDPTKAHKVLGITLQHTEKRDFQTPSVQQAFRSDRETMKAHGHVRTRSATVNDSDELTPLPINYRLALQSLERLDTNPPPPPSSGTTSTSTGELRPSSTPPRRSKSMAVGGRSATSRKTTSSMIMGVGTMHKPPTGVTSRQSSESIPRPIRSASEEIATRHQSLSLTPSTSSSFQNRPTTKKKRWSHPDLPAKAEKSHNARVDALNAAAARGVQVRAVPVRSPPHSVIEERPASVDSIDMEVEGYLNSPRLSQKIRHPQTGRVISFSEVGDPQGFAVFVCVGMGLTRYVMAFYDQLALTLKLRLITPDRPGIGGSQVDPNGTPLSWPGEHLIRII